MLKTKISREFLCLTYVFVGKEAELLEFLFEVFLMINLKFYIQSAYILVFYCGIAILTLKWLKMTSTFLSLLTLWLTGLSWMAFLPQVMRGMNWVRGSKMAPHTLCNWCQCSVNRSTLVPLPLLFLCELLTGFQKAESGSFLLLKTKAWMSQISLPLHSTCWSRFCSQSRVKGEQTHPMPPEVRSVITYKKGKNCGELPLETSYHSLFMELLVEGSRSW